MEHIWEINENERTCTVSRVAHQYLHDTGEDELKKSRASVIFFLDDTVKEGVLEYELETGKGGHHRVCFPAIKPEEFTSYFDDNKQAERGLHHIDAYANMFLI